MDTRELKSEIRSALRDPEHVLGALGLLESSRKNHSGYMICCPWHSEKTPSCSVRSHPDDGTLSVYCFGCGEGGDVFSLIAAVNGLDPRNNFRAIMEYAGAMAGISIRENWTPEQKTERPVFVPKIPVYPPESEIHNLWFESVAPYQIRPARQWFEIKQLSAEMAAGYCRVIPKKYEMPEWGKNWVKTGHRLLFPLYDSRGNMKSLKARCLDVSNKWKNLVPKGYSVKGLIMADIDGHKLLQSGNPENEPFNIVFCEGEVDFLVALQTKDTAPKNTAVFGVYSGAWSTDHALRLGKNITIFFFTDRDRAGMKYKQDISRTFVEAYRGI